MGGKKKGGKAKKGKGGDDDGEIDQGTLNEILTAKVQALRSRLFLEQERRENAVAKVADLNTGDEELLVEMKDES